MEQGVLQGSVTVSRGWVHDKTRRLVDDEDGFILVDDIQGNILPLTIGRHLDFRMQFHLLATQHLVFGGQGLAVDRRVPAADPALQFAAGEIRKDFGQCLVEPHARQIKGDVGDHEFLMIVCFVRVVKFGHCF